MSEDRATPDAIYAMGLVQLMDRTNTHHFVVDLENLDMERARGLSLNVDVVHGKTLTFSTGLCKCPKCIAVTGSRQ